MTGSEEVRLKSAVQTAQGKSYPYRFFSKNCAYYVHRLLKEAIPTLPNIDGNISPLDVVRLVGKYKGSSLTSLRPAVSNHLRDSESKLESKFLNTVKNQSWQFLASDNKWLQNLDRSERVYIQDYFLLKSQESKSPLEDQVLDGLRNLRLQNARPTGKENETTNMIGSSFDLNEIHLSKKINAIGKFNSKKGIGITLGYRSALHSIDDNWEGFRKLNTLEILGFELSAFDKGKNLQIEKFILFSQRSILPKDLYSREASWLLEMKAENGGVLGVDIIHIVLRMGWGTGYQIGSKLYVYNLILTSIQGTKDDRMLIVPGIQTGFVSIGKTWRMGGEFNWEASFLKLLHRSQRFDFWLTRDLGTSLSVSTGVNLQGKCWTFGFGFSRSYGRL